VVSSLIASSLYIETTSSWKALSDLCMRSQLPPMQVFPAFSIILAVLTLFGSAIRLLFPHALNWEQDLTPQLDPIALIRQYLRGQFSTPHPPSLSTLSSLHLQYSKYAAMIKLAAQELASVFTETTFSISRLPLLRTLPSSRCSLSKIPPSLLPKLQRSHFRRS